MSYADRYDPDQDFDHWYTDATALAIADWLRPGDRVLELGCATGRMSASMCSHGAEVVGVDHAEAYLDRARERGLDRASFVAGDIQSIRVAGSFDHVVVANVVHEVSEPERLFANAAQHLSPSGYLHVTLQNPRSIHRLVGLELGMIEALDELSERGRELDTLEVFDADQLVRFGLRAGLRVVHRGGIMLKPLPNDLMAQLPDRILDGFVRAAHHLPEHASMNLLVFRPARADDGGDG